MPEAAAPAFCGVFTLEGRVCQRPVGSCPAHDGSEAQRSVQKCGCGCHAKGGVCGRCREWCPIASAVLDERERMAEEARARLASRGLVAWSRAAAASEPGQPVLEKPTTDVPAEHGDADLPVAVRPAGSTPAVGAPAPACVLCGRPVDNGSPEGICNFHGSDEVREYRLRGVGGRAASTRRREPSNRPPSPGQKFVECPGSAHENEAYVDNCSLCAPRWGWVSVPEAYVKCATCTGWCPPDRIGPGGACDNCPPPAAPAPEVRHCSVREPGAAYEGRVLERCEAVIGDDVLCSACGGGEPVRPGRATKCYAHCQSIDHYGAPLTMSTQVAKWGLVLRAQGLAFQGEVRELESEKLGAPVVRVLPKIFGGTDAEKVVGEMMTFVDGLRNDRSEWGIPAKLPYAPPTVTPLPASLRGPRFGQEEREHAIFEAAVRRDRGDETCSEADGFDPENWDGVKPHAMATALALPSPGDSREDRARMQRFANEAAAEVMSWEMAWADLGDAGDVDVSTLRRARNLADACVVSLLSRLGSVR